MIASSLPMSREGTPFDRHMSRRLQICRSTEVPEVSCRNKD